MALRLTLPLSVVVVVSVVSGCAKKSADLEPFYVPDAYFGTMDCAKINTEYQRVTSRAMVIGQARDDFEGRRIAAMILLGLLVGPVIIPENPQSEIEVRSLKGEAQSLERVAASKNCPLATHIAEQRKELQDPVPIEPAKSIFSVPMSAVAQAAKKDPSLMTAAERMELQAGPGYRNYPRQTSGYF